MKVELKPNSYLYPQPVLIIGSYDDNNIPDAMNAAWGGVSDFNEISMCISKTHKTVENILKRKGFTVAMGTRKTLVESDYFGIVSGHDVTNKIEKAKMHVKKSSKINAPVIEEYPLTLECELVSYDEENEIMKGKIVGVIVDDSILTNGKIDVTKLEPISYDPSMHKYYLVKEAVGNAFKDGKEIVK